jgi:putative membrane protein
MMHWGYGIGWVELLCGGFVVLLVLGGLIALAVILLTRSYSGRGSSGGATRTSSRTPLEILQERYARGEISKEEYLEMREHLRE